MTAQKTYLPFAWYKILIIWVVWQVAAFLTGNFAPIFLPFQNTFSNYAIQEQAQMPKWIEQWSNFDGGAYLLLSERGYKDAGLLQAYFPGYHQLIRVVAICISIFSPVEFNPIRIRMIIGMSISAFSSLGMCFILMKYLSLKHSDKISLYSLFALLFFPSAFFFHAVYTESLFLFFVFAAFLSYEKKQWFLLSICIMASTATRLVGIFLVPAFLFDLIAKEYFSSKTTSGVTQIKTIFLTHWQKIIGICAGSFGLLGYMLFCAINFGDPLSFFHVQSEFGAGRQEKIILLPQVIWRYFKILYTVRPFDLKYFAYSQEFFISIAVLSTLVLGSIFWKRYKLSLAELFFSFGAFILPTLTGNFSSMPRYVIVCFPIYIIGAYYLAQHKKLRYFYFVCSFLLMVFNTILFIQGRWVA